MKCANCYDTVAGFLADKDKTIAEQQALIEKMRIALQDFVDSESYGDSIGRDDAYSVMITLASIKAQNALAAYQAKPINESVKC